MQSDTRRGIVSRKVHAPASKKSAGLSEVTIFSLLGLAIAVFLAAHNWFLVQAFAH
jgi:hypothetical protein